MGLADDSLNALGIGATTAGALTMIHKFHIHAMPHIPGAPAQGGAMALVGGIGLFAVYKAIAAAGGH